MKIKEVSIVEYNVKADAQSGLDRAPRMSAFKLVLWACLVILGAIALAFVTGLINPHEKVNGLWLVVAAGSI